MSVTDNTIAETKQSTTPTCSNNGTHSEGYTGAFEGPEKLLEMWFAPNAQAAKLVNQAGKLSDEDFDQWSEVRDGLRCVPRAVWRDMLDLVHCQVLNTLCNEHLDSYLLSESSFFVYPHKLVLKTCGTTTLLYAIPRILEIARAYLGVVGAYQVFYSRKNFMFPDQQEELHSSWEREVRYLDEFFPEGSAYLIGKTNRDHWHLYLSGPYDTSAMQTAAENAAMLDGALLGQTIASDLDHGYTARAAHDEDTDPVHGLGSAAAIGADTTVEILMTGLDPDRMRLMYIDGIGAEEGSRGGKAVERASGIADIYPESSTDSFLFSPCGFSLNGLQGDGYYTIHVTPEAHCSYASFETNVSNDRAIDLLNPAGVKNLVEQVTRVFGPRFVTVTVFKARNDSLPNHTTNTSPARGGYKAVDRVLYEFDHYWLRYGYYVRSD
ncbi:S-adenosylmethionine decarboxylase [Linderina pennispora]|uniref:adenosylmethionine decarboxylase n=1 Tax=Linderina pennispora TaxID=61395 RepID=A0A1Y1WDM7_9FUNG|nr:S-adenosylmethionine decarboxylase [Linderina pennispora]ORX71629.1 S-adenosylmethionine decarboxylase [Linderina pennispora]